MAIPHKKSLLQHAASVFVAMCDCEDLAPKTLIPRCSSAIKGVGKLEHQPQLRTLLGGRVAQKEQ